MARLSRLYIDRMSHLTEEQRTELAALLDKEVGKLARSMKVSEEAMRPVELDQTAVGRLSRMDSLQSQSMAKNLAEREQVRFALLREALVRLDAGTFGLCSECAAPVPFERLVIFPEAPTCQSCG